MQPTKSPAKSLAWTEADRLTAVDSYQVLPPTPESAYDVLARQAADICGTPFSMITILTEDHQWFKSAVGTDLTGTSRAISFCTHAIEQNETLIVNDATKDVRFSDNPLVTNAPHIRFYAGVPLLTPRGMPVGTLCILDQKPRDFTADQQATLEKLAGHVVELLEQRKAIIDQVSVRATA